MDVVRTQRKMARRSRTVNSPTTEEKSRNGRESSFRSPPIPRRSTPLAGLRPRRAISAPPGPERRRLLEDHYRVDNTNDKRGIVLPGVPRYDPDWARDSHDFFNLVVLVPVVALNVMNWDWDLLLNMPRNKTVADAWTGQHFEYFFYTTAFYFLVDLTWILSIPSCVKSPATIIQHHVATMLYILIPYLEPDYRWCMGACMLVEINTWFLIARRVFNKQGFPPWIIDLSFVSIRIKLISIFFYVTWIGIRCILYPYLMPLFYQVWQQHSLKVGTKLNLVFLCVPLHACFCLLNLKWSYDLLMSKIRYWRRKGDWKAANKGL